MASESHGGTKAAWTAVSIIVLGCLVSAVALPISSPVLFFVGLAVVVLGVVVGKVMSMMGLGQTVAYKDRRDPDYDEEQSRRRQAEDAAVGDDQAAEPVVTAEPGTAESDAPQSGNDGSAPSEQMTSEPVANEPSRAAPTQEKNS